MTNTSVIDQIKQNREIYSKQRQEAIRIFISAIDGWIIKLINVESCTFKKPVTRNFDYYAFKIKLRGDEDPRDIYRAFDKLHYKWKSEGIIVDLSVVENFYVKVSVDEHRL